MDYYQKYIKYKNKYIDLKNKKILKGGNLYSIYSDDLNNLLTNHNIN